MSLYTEELDRLAAILNPTEVVLMKERKDEWTSTLSLMIGGLPVSEDPGDAIERAFGEILREYTTPGYTGLASEFEVICDNKTYR